MNNLSTWPSPNPRAPTVRTRKMRSLLVLTAYFIGCAYLIHFSLNLHSLEYFLGVLFGVNFVFLFTQSAVARLRPGVTPEAIEWNRETSMLMAAGIGIIANAVMQTLALRYGHLHIPKDAFLSVYCAILFFGSPMPLLPGDELFYKTSNRARSIMFLAVIVSSIWRIGMLVPALFMYVDRDHSLTDGLDGSDLTIRHREVLGVVEAGLSVVATVGIILASGWITLDHNPWSH